MNIASRDEKFNVLHFLAQYGVKLRDGDREQLSHIVTQILHSQKYVSFTCVTNNV